LREWRRRWGTITPKARAADYPLWKAFEGKQLRLYEGLTKAESSILCQARTGKIGLRAFLHLRGVPGVDPICPCGEAPQTAEHLFLCQDEKSRELRRLGYRSEREVRQAFREPKMAKKLAREILRSGWLQEYRAAQRLAQEDAMEALRVGIQVEEERPQPTRRRRRRRRPPAP